MFECISMDFYKVLSTIVVFIACNVFAIIIFSEYLLIKCLRSCTVEEVVRGFVITVMSLCSSYKYSL